MQSAGRVRRAKKDIELNGCNEQLRSADGYRAAGEGNASE